MEHVGTDFLQRLLQWDPYDRLSGLEALAHPYFDELREEGLQFPTGNCLPNIFDFTKKEISKDIDPSILLIIKPDWYRDQLLKIKH